MPSAIASVVVKQQNNLLFTENVVRPCDWKSLNFQSSRVSKLPMDCHLNRFMKNVDGSRHLDSKSVAIEYSSEEISK